MPLPEDVTAGVSEGHLSHHEVLRVRHNADGATPALSEGVESGDQHDAHHDAFKAWYDAAHPGNPLTVFTTWASHELIHEALAVWENSRTADTTAPSTPAGLTATPAGSTTVNLAWSATADTTSYLLYRDGVLIATQPVTDPRTYADLGLTASTAYSYRIAARDGVGNTSAQSSAVIATTAATEDTTPPPVPTGLTATPVSDTAINLAWNASTGATVYHLRRGGVIIATQAGLTFADTGLTAATGYSYTVDAQDAAGNVSTPSAAIIGTTNNAPIDTTPPSVPTGLTATPASSSSVNLSWNASTGSPVSYTVRRGGLVILTQAGLTATDTGLLPATLYSYTVSATDAAGNSSAQSAAATATTTAAADTTPPPVPTGLTAVTVSSTAIDVSWLAAGDATSYTLRRDGSSIAVQAGLTFTDTGRTPSTLYSYTVAASDAAGNFSAQSSAATATTAPAPDITAPTVPGSVLASVVSATSIAVTWAASTDAVGVANYTIRRGGVPIVIQAANLPLIFTDTGLTPSTLYSYTVAATDQAGNASAQSTATTATTPVATDVTPPEVPTNLRTISVQPTTVTLEWDASIDAATYTLYRDDVIVDTTTGLIAVSTGLSSSSTYRFAVLATDAAGNSSAQSPALVVVTTAIVDTTPPAVPTGLRSTVVSATQINVAWDAVLDAATYLVRRGGLAIAVVEETNYPDISLTAATTYSYTVAATDPAGNTSAPSPPTSATTRAAADTTAPTVPTGLVATAASSTSISLSWNASGGSAVYDKARYDIDIYDDTDVANYLLRRNGVLIVTQPGLTYTDTGLTPGTTYSYTVSAVDAAGNASPQSLVTSAATTAVSVTTFSEPFTTALTLTWTNLLETLSVATGGIKGTTTGDTSRHRAEHSVGSVDMFSEVTWEDTGTATNRAVGVMTRYAATADTAYLFRISDVDDNFSFWKIVNGVSTRLFGPTVVAGGTTFPGVLRLESQGSTHRCYFKGVLLGTFTDASITTGTRGGLGTFNSSGGILLDNFKTGSLTTASGDVTAPTVPGSVVATVNSFDAITLTWAASTDAVGVANYTIRRDGVIVGTRTASPFVNTGLTPNTLYSYTVTASDAAGNTSAQSTAATATTSAGVTLRSALQRFSLTLPTGTRHATDVVSRDALVAGYSNPSYFNDTADGQGFHFRCPANGVQPYPFAPGAHTELRQVKADGSNDAWSSAQATVRTWEAQYTINHLPPGDPEVCLFQMNNGIGPVVSLSTFRYVANGPAVLQLWVNNIALAPNFDSDVVAGDTFTFKISIGNNVINTWLNGVAQHVNLAAPADTGQNYFKAGLFNQFDAVGVPATEYSDIDMRGVSYTEAGVGTLPDLIVTDITWSPASPTVGQAVTFTAVVQNTGGVATPDGVVIGVRFDVDGAFVAFSDSDNSSLAASASRSFVPNSVPPTWTAVAGTHTVLAWVDDVNRMVETSEANNTRTEATLTVAGAGTTPDPVGTATLQEQASGTELILGVPTGTASGEVLVAQIGQTQTGGSGAAPLYRSHTSTYHDTGGTIPQPCAKPAGLATGDVLLAFISHGNNATNQAGELTTVPAGFTTIAPWRENAGGSGFWYYKVITDAGSEPATYGFADVIDNEFAVYLIAYSGCDNSAPIHVAATNVSADNNDGLSLSVTTSLTNTRLVAFVTADDTGSQPFGNGGMTATRMADEGVTSAQLNSAIFDETAATTGIKTRLFTYNGTATTAIPLGVLLALKGAFAGAPPGGWNLLASVTQSGNVKVDAWYRVATANEPSTYTWGGLFNGPTTGHMQRFEGIDNTSPLDVLAQVASSASIQSLVVPSITTVTNGAVLIGGAVLNATTAADIVTPAGMTLINKSAGVGRESSWAYEARPTAGATGTRTWGQNPTGTAREYVGWSGALRSAGGTPPPPPPPPPPTEIVPLTGPSGTLTHVVIGGITSTGAVAVAKTATATQVRLKASTAADLLTTPRYSNTVTPDAQGMSRLVITGLNPFTQYSFGIECGPALDSSKRGRFKTAAIAPANVSVAFGSCLNASDSPVFARIQARNPNMFVHVGDMWYDDGASTSADSYRSHYNAKLSTAGQGTLMRNIPSIYTYSDHCFGMNNNSKGSDNATVTSTSWAVWRQYMPYPGTLSHATSIYHTYALTPRVRVIVTDTRGFKNSASSSSSATMLGATQKAWFKALITNSTEPFIIWAQDVPWIGASTGSDDEWFGYPTERAELGAHIDASNKHVVILAGDAHMVTFDNGSNSVGNIPVFHAGPFHNAGSVKGGPYSGGASDLSGTLNQYGMVTVTDTGTTTMTVRFDGYNNSNAVMKTITLSLSVPAWTGPTTPPPGGGGTTPPPPTGAENFNGWTPGTNTLPPLLPNFPTAATTGVFNDARRAALTVVNGNYTASSAGLVTGLHITGEVIVNVAGVRFENCWIEGRISGHASRPVFIHCDIGHVTPLTDTNDNFRYAVSVYRCNVFAGQDGIKPTGDNCVIQDNFFHDMLIQTDTGQDPPVSHNDVIQMNDATTNCRIVHNTFMNWGMNGFASPPQNCTRATGPNWGEHTNDHAGGNVSSTIQINGTAGGSGMLVENNFFDGNPDWVLNVGDPGPSITVRGNRFVRGGYQNTAVISGASRIDTFVDNRFTDNNGLIPGSSA